MSAPGPSGETAWRVEWLEVVDSTNGLLLGRARAGEAEGLVIAARSQRQGRGRLGRSWHSPRGRGLYFSALLRPPLPPRRAPLCTLLAGVAAAEALSSLSGVQVGLKWPNDLRAGRKKLGGILCEYEPGGGPPPAIVVGIGVNLSGEGADFPPELRDRATSLQEAGGRLASPPEALNLLLRRLDFWYKELVRTGFEPVRRRWTEMCDNLGQEVAVSAQNETLRGRVLGIDSAGRLLLASPGGAVHRAEAGEVIET